MIAVNDYESPALYPHEIFCPNSHFYALCNHEARSVEDPARAFDPGRLERCRYFGDDHEYKERENKIVPIANVQPSVHLTGEKL